MSATKIPLSLVKVASPCTASWEQMSGDDTARFCGQCSQHVYNLSEMTEKAAQELILEHEGHLCVRFYKRADGTMMTKDCPVGWRAIQRRVALVAGASVAFVVAAFGMLTLGVFASSVRGNGNGGVRFVNPILRVQNWLNPPMVQGGMEMPVMPPRHDNDMVMGKMCPPQVVPQVEKPPPQERAVPAAPNEELK